MTRPPRKRYAAPIADPAITAHIPTHGSDRTLMHMDPSPQPAHMVELLPPVTPKGLIPEPVRAHLKVSASRVRARASDVAASSRASSSSSRAAPRARERDDGARARASRAVRPRATGTHRAPACSP